MNAKEPEAAKLKALQEAACMGWADIAAGRHADPANAATAATAVRVSS